MNDITLRLTGIHKAYQTQANKPVEVLKDANLTLKPGEVVALVAPSGSGKSTLLHIAGLLDAADAGSVEICGQDLTGASDTMRTTTRRNDVGFVYQFHHLLPEFTAAENIILPQLAAGIRMKEAEERAKHLMDEIGLSSRLHHRPAALSGGEQQRVAFCRALANRPALLLADEPTGNLDPATSDLVFETLLKLVRQTGLSALIATHNMELAARMDRQVRLVDGALEPS